MIIADLDEEAGLENVNFIQSQKGIAHFVKTDVSKVESIKFVSFSMKGPSI